MEGYPSMGTIYSLREQYGAKRLIWAVIENNLNDKTSTLVVVEDCPENGKKAKVDAQWLCERSPIGPILPPDGEIVVENGIEFVRPVEEEVQSQILRIKNN